MHLCFCDDWKIPDIFIIVPLSLVSKAKMYLWIGDRALNAKKNLPTWAKDMSPNLQIKKVTEM